VVAVFRRTVVVFLAAAAAVVPLIGVASPSAVAATRPTLRFGARGPAVVALQQRLIQLRYLDVVRADGVFGAGTYHGVVAFQKVQRIARDGVVGPATWAKLDTPLRPRPRYPRASTSLEVDLSRQVVYYAYAGTVRGILDSSTGSGRLYWQNGSWHRAATPTGRFRIYRSIAGWHLSPLGWMYRPYYFYGGYAVHGSTSVPAYPASHGCIRLTVTSMDRLAPKLWMGMPFAVYAG
jgi:N-acetylmuramoyl-L-alanine amidase